MKPTALVVAATLLGLSASGASAATPSADLYLKCRSGDGRLDTLYRFRPDAGELYSWSPKLGWSTNLCRNLFLTDNGLRRNGWITTCAFTPTTLTYSTRFVDQGLTLHPADAQAFGIRVDRRTGAFTSYGVFSGEPAQVKPADNAPGTCTPATEPKAAATQ